jgi:hypothetical protein
VPSRARPRRRAGAPAIRRFRGAFDRRSRNRAPGRRGCHGGASGPCPLRVQTVKLSALFARHALESVDLLKFDIEGAELDALDLRELDRVAQIVGEVHAPGHEQLEMLVARLEPAFDVETRPLEPGWLLRARRRASRP